MRIQSCFLGRNEARYKAKTAFVAVLSNDVDTDDDEMIGRCFV